MAIYNLKISKSNHRRPQNKVAYINRVDDFSYEKDNAKYDDFVYSESNNLPSFAEGNPIKFWDYAEKNERVNSNLFREIEFSLPHELTEIENIELAQKFAEELFGDKYVYNFAIHNKKSSEDGVNNIHCHLMFCERELDGIDRDTPELFFKRYSSQNPELGGAKKNREWKEISKYYEIRQTWETICNEKLKEKNIEPISSLSLEKQKIIALLENNFLKAEMLDREPVNYNKKFVDYTTNEEAKKRVMEIYEYNKQIRELKIKEFKLKETDYERENELARRRHFGIDSNEEEKDFSSNFDIEKFKESINYTEILTATIDNKILIDKTEKRLEEIKEYLKPEKLNVVALDNLTKREYSRINKRHQKNLDIYNSLEDKSTLLPSIAEQMKKDKDYLDSWKNDKTKQQRIEKMENQILENLNNRIETQNKNLEILTNNQFVNIFDSYDSKNHEITSLLLKDTVHNIDDYLEKKYNKDKEVKALAKEMRRDYKKDVYADDINISAKYEEYLKEKENRLFKDPSQREKELEKELDRYNLYNDTKEKVEELKKKDNELYKKLRKEQDNLDGRIKYSKLFEKELKSHLKMKNAYDKIKTKFRYKEVEDTNDLFEKLKYNTTAKKYKLKTFNIPELTNDEKIETNKKARNNINELKEKIEKYQKYLSKNILSDEEIKIRLYDRYSDNEYSKNLKSLEENKEKLKIARNGGERNIAQIAIDDANKKINKIEEKCEIYDQDIRVEKTTQKTINIVYFTLVRQAKEELKENYDVLKTIKPEKTKTSGTKAKNSKGKTHRSSPSYRSPERKSKGIGKIGQAGAIEIETDEKRRRREARERGGYGIGD